LHLHFHILIQRQRRADADLDLLRRWLTDQQAVFATDIGRNRLIHPQTTYANRVRHHDAVH